MLREKSFFATRLKTYVQEFRNITIDSKILHYTVCNIIISSGKCFSVIQYIATEKH